MPTILFVDDKIKFAGGDILFVPTGADPDDCDCCGTQCPVCVDYTYGQSAVTISGFPTTITFEGLTPIFNQRIQRDWVGMNVINGTYNVDTDDNCIWGSVSANKKFTITQRLYSNFGCGGGLGTLLSTTDTEVTCIVTVTSATVAINFAGFSTGIGTCKNIFLSIADNCVGGTDSEFFACNGCPSIAGITASAVWVPTLV